MCPMIQPRLDPSLPPMLEDRNSTDRSREVLERALWRWHRGLSAVIADVIRGSVTVRAVAERIGVGRGTAHNVVRLLQAETVPGLVASLPGRKARESLLNKCLSTGAAEVLLDEFDAAQTVLEGTLHRYAPTSARLLAITCGDASDDDLRRRLVRAFQSRFEVDQLMTGGYAETLIAAQMVVPSADDIHADVAALQLIDGIAASRPRTQFEVYRSFLAGGSCSAELQESSCLGLETMTLMQSHSDAGFASLLAEIDDELETDRRMLAFLQHRIAAGPMDSEFEGDFAEQSLPVLLPIRSLSYELWLHEDLRRKSEPTTHLYYNMITAISDFDRHNRSGVPMPADLKLMDTPLAVGDLDPQLAAKRNALVRLAADWLGQPVEKLVCYRVSLPCPPMGSRVGIRWLLNNPPKAGDRRSST